MKMKDKSGELRKLLDLPRDVVTVISGLATQARQSVKSYMEKVLIDHAKSKKKP